MNLPEEIVGLRSDLRMSKNEHCTHGYPEGDPRDSCQGLKKPVGNIGFFVTTEPEFWAQTMKMF